MRAFLGVILAFVAMAVLVLALSMAPWVVFGLDAVLQPGRFDSTGAFNTYAVLVAIAGAFLAGRLCLAVGRSRIAVVSLAALCFAGGMVNATAQHRKPEPGPRGPGMTVAQAIAQRKEPAWFTLLMPFAGFAGVLAGGRSSRRVATSVKEYTSTSTIHASPEAVWTILTDAAGYADWNPEIVEIVGRMELGGRIRARVKVGGGAIRAVPMRVTAFTAPSHMEWTGGLPLGLFTGRRNFDVTPRDGGAEFRMHLRMSGPLAPLILKSLGDRQPEIDTFSAALKARAERGATS